jgi:hypothetical protein
MNDRQNFLNKINGKNDNPPLFDRSAVSDIHNKIVNKITRRDGSGQQSKNEVDAKAELVMEKDIMLRNSVKELVDAIVDLGDREIALKLIAEHIYMLNEVFKNFER